MIIGGAVLLGGCASPHSTAPGLVSQSEARDGRTVGYDDRQIARIRRGETAEPQLLEWFGPPIRRELKEDGRAYLEWTFDPGTGDSANAAGVLSVSLAPDGKVQAYSARRDPRLKHRTVEFVEKSDADLREHRAQWAREGWNVLSVSDRLPQADGTVHRKVELSRPGGNSTTNRAYDDGQVSKIQRGGTSESQLLEWFGSPDSRDVKADGRALLAWSFSGRGSGAGDSGGLQVNLAPDGKVDAYSARRSNN